MADNPGNRCSASWAWTAPPRSRSRQPRQYKRRVLVKSQHPPRFSHRLETPSINGLTNRTSLHRRQGHSQQVVHVKRLHSRPKSKSRLDAYNREYEALHKPLASTSPLNTTGQPASQAPAVTTASSAQPPTPPKTNSDEIITIQNPETRRPYIKTGTWIEARLDMTAITDLPGDLHGRITADVIGFRNGEPIKLIPMGAALIGGYSSRLTYGHDRLMQSWTGIVFADGRKIALPEVSAADSTGAAGLKDKIDNHYSKLLRDAGLLTVFNVGIALTQRNQSLLTSPSIGNTIGQSVGSTMGEIGSQLIGRNIALQPSGTLRPGGEFRIQVKHDIVFAGKL
jgi:type IV secretory pathway VirB10-like protein